MFCSALLPVLEMFSAVTIVSAYGSKNRSYPPNSWCKRTSAAAENTGL